MWGAQVDVKVVISPVYAHMHVGDALYRSLRQCNHLLPHTQALRNGGEYTLA